MSHSSSSHQRCTGFGGDTTRSRTSSRASRRPGSHQPDTPDPFTRGSRRTSGTSSQYTDEDSQQQRLMSLLGRFTNEQQQQQQHTYISAEPPSTNNSESTGSSQRRLQFPSPTPPSSAEFSSSSGDSLPAVTHLSLPTLERPSSKSPGAKGRKKHAQRESVSVGSTSRANLPQQKQQHHHQKQKERRHLGGRAPREAEISGGGDSTISPKPAPMHQERRSGSTLPTRESGTTPATEEEEEVRLDQGGQSLADRPDVQQGEEQPHFTYFGNPFAHLLALSSQKKDQQEDSGGLSPSYSWMTGTSSYNSPRTITLDDLRKASGIPAENEQASEGQKLASASRMPYAQSAVRKQSTLAVSSGLDSQATSAESSARNSGADWSRSPAATRRSLEKDRDSGLFGGKFSLTSPGSSTPENDGRSPHVPGGFEPIAELDEDGSWSQASRVQKGRQRPAGVSQEVFSSPGLSSVISDGERAALEKRVRRPQYEVRVLPPESLVRTPSLLRSPTPESMMRAHSPAPSPGRRRSTTVASEDSKSKTVSRSRSRSMGGGSGSSKSSRSRVASPEDEIPLLQQSDGGDENNGETGNYSIPLIPPPPSGDLQFINPFVAGHYHDIPEPSTRRAGDEDAQSATKTRIRHRRRKQREQRTPTVASSIGSPAYTLTSAYSPSYAESNATHEFAFLGIHKADSSPSVASRRSARMPQPHLNVGGDRASTSGSSRRRTHQRSESTGSRVSSIREGFEELERRSRFDESKSRPSSALSNKSRGAESSRPHTPVLERWEQAKRAAPARKGDKTARAETPPVQSDDNGGGHRVSRIREKIEEWQQRNEFPGSSDDTSHSGTPTRTSGTESASTQVAGQPQAVGEIVPVSVRRRTENSSSSQNTTGSPHLVPLTPMMKRKETETNALKVDTRKGVRSSTVKSSESRFSAATTTSSNVPPSLFGSDKSTFSSPLLSGLPEISVPSDVPSLRTISTMRSRADALSRRESKKSTLSKEASIHPISGPKADSKPRAEPLQKLKPTNPSSKQRRASPDESPKLYESVRSALSSPVSVGGHRKRPLVTDVRTASAEIMKDVRGVSIGTLDLQTTPESHAMRASRGSSNDENAMQGEPSNERRPPRRSSKDIIESPAPTLDPVVSLAERRAWAKMKPHERPPLAHMATTEGADMRKWEARLAERAEIGRRPKVGDTPALAKESKASGGLSPGSVSSTKSGTTSSGTAEFTRSEVIDNTLATLEGVKPPHKGAPKAMRRKGKDARHRKTRQNRDNGLESIVESPQVTASEPFPEQPSVGLQSSHRPLPQIPVKKRADTEPAIPTPPPRPSRAHTTEGDSGLPSTQPNSTSTVSSRFTAKIPSQRMGKHGSSPLNPRKSVGGPRMPNTQRRHGTQTTADSRPPLPTIYSRVTTQDESQMKAEADNKRVVSGYAGVLQYPKRIYNSVVDGWNKPVPRLEAKPSGSAGDSKKPPNRWPMKHAPSQAISVVDIEQLPGRPTRRHSFNGSTYLESEKMEMALSPKENLRRKLTFKDRVRGAFSILAGKRIPAAMIDPSEIHESIKRVNTQHYPTSPSRLGLRRRTSINTIDDHKKEEEELRGRLNKLTSIGGGDSGSIPVWDGQSVHVSVVESPGIWSPAPTSKFSFSASEIVPNAKPLPQIPVTQQTASDLFKYPSQNSAKTPSPMFHNSTDTTPPNTGNLSGSNPFAQPIKPEMTERPKSRPSTFSTPMASVVGSKPLPVPGQVSGPVSMLEKDKIPGDMNVVGSQSIHVGMAQVDSQPSVGGGQIGYPVEKPRKQSMLKRLFSGWKRPVETPLLQTQPQAFQGPQQQQSFQGQPQQQSFQGQPQQQSFQGQSQQQSFQGQPQQQSFQGQSQQQVQSGKQSNSLGPIQAGRLGGVVEAGAGLAFGKILGMFKSRKDEDNNEKPAETANPSTAGNNISGQQPIKQQQQFDPSQQSFQQQQQQQQQVNPSQQSVQQQQHDPYVPPVGEPQSSQFGPSQQSFQQQQHIAIPMPSQPVLPPSSVQGNQLGPPSQMMHQHAPQPTNQASMAFPGSSSIAQVYPPYSNSPAQDNSVQGQSSTIAPSATNGSLQGGFQQQQQQAPPDIGFVAPVSSQPQQPSQPPGQSYSDFSPGFTPDPGSNQSPVTPNEAPQSHPSKLASIMSGIPLVGKLFGSSTSQAPPKPSSGGASGSHNNNAQSPGASSYHSVATATGEGEQQPGGLMAMLKSGFGAYTMPLLLPVITRMVRSDLIPMVGRYATQYPLVEQRDAKLVQESARASQPKVTNGSAPFAVPEFGDGAPGLAYRMLDDRIENLVRPSFTKLRKFRRAPEVWDDAEASAIARAVRDKWAAHENGVRKGHAQLANALSRSSISRAKHTISDLATAERGGHYEAGEERESALGWVGRALGGLFAKQSEPAQVANRVRTGSIGFNAMRSPQSQGYVRSRGADEDALHDGTMNIDFDDIGENLPTSDSGNASSEGTAHGLPAESPKKAPIFQRLLRGWNTHKADPEPDEAPEPSRILERPPDNSPHFPPMFPPFSHMPRRMVDNILHRVNEPRVSIGTESKPLLWRRRGMWGVHSEIDPYSTGSEWTFRKSEEFGTPFPKRLGDVKQPKIWRRNGAKIGAQADRDGIPRWTTHLKIIRDYIQYIGLVLGAAGYTVSPVDSTVGDRWPWMIVSGIPKALGFEWADLSTTTGKSTGFLIVFSAIALGALCLWVFGTVIGLKKASNNEPTPDSEASSVWQHAPFRAASNPIAAASQWVRQMPKWKRMQILFATLTTLYIPVIKLVLEAIVWDQGFWSVPNPYRESDHPRFGDGDAGMRSPGDFCYTTTMNDGTFNGSYLLLPVSVFVLLVYGLYFPLHLRNLPTRHMPDIPGWRDGRLRREKKETTPVAATPSGSALQIDEPQDSSSQQRAFVADRNNAQSSDSDSEYNEPRMNGADALFLQGIAEQMGFNPHTASGLYNIIATVMQQNGQPSQEADEDSKGFFDKLMNKIKGLFSKPGSDSDTSIDASNTSGGSPGSQKKQKLNKIQRREQIRLLSTIRYRNALDTDPSHVRFLYDAYYPAHTAAQYRDLRWKFVVVLVTVLLNKDNCWLRQHTRHSIDAARISLTLILVLLMIRAHNSHRPYFDPTANLSMLISRIGILVAVIFAFPLFLTRTPLAQSHTGTAMALSLVNLLVLLLLVWLALSSIPRMRRAAAQFAPAAPLELSPGILTAMSAYDPLLRRLLIERVWQDTWSAILLASRDFRLLPNHTLKFSVSPARAPYLLNYIGFAAERHLENLRVYDAIGRHAYCTAIERERDAASAMREILDSFHGPDMYFNPYEDTSDVIRSRQSVGPTEVRSWFGMVYVVPFPFTACIVYDDLPHRHIALASPADLALFVAQNRDPRITQKREVRYALRALHAQRVTLTFIEHGKPDGTHLRYCPPSSPDARAAYLREHAGRRRILLRGILSVRHHATVKWRGVYNTNHGFECSLRVTDETTAAPHLVDDFERASNAFRKHFFEAGGTPISKKTRNALGIDASNVHLLGIYDDFEYNERLRGLFAENMETIDERYAHILEVLSAHRKESAAEFDRKRTGLSPAFHVDIFAPGPESCHARDLPIDGRTTALGDVAEPNSSWQNDAHGRLSFIPTRAQLADRLQRDESNEYVQLLMRDHRRDIDALYERLSALVPSSSNDPVRFAWYIFWDDVYRRYARSIKQFAQHEPDFCPLYPQALPYYPLARPQLEEFLFRRGLWKPKGKAHARLPKWFANRTDVYEMNEIGEPMPAPEYVPGLATGVRGDGSVGLVQSDDAQVLDTTMKGVVTAKDVLPFEPGVRASGFLHSGHINRLYTWLNVIAHKT